MTRHLAENLGRDVGSENVFRDVNDLIAGTLWKESLRAALEDCDAAVFVVGSEWVGPRADGSRRIDDRDDPVAAEVEQAIDLDDRCSAIPVLVDVDTHPSELPAAVAPLFDRHAIRSTYADLVETPTKDYQGVLVGVWESIRQRTPRGVLVIGDDDGSARLDAVIDEMKHAKLIDARRLSRFTAGACVVSARRLRKGAKKWPDAIVVTEDPEPSPTLSARLCALDELPTVGTVSLVGAGVAAGFALGNVLGVGAGASSSTTFTAATQVAPAVPQIGTSPLSAISSSWIHATTGVKVGAGIAATAAVATTAVAVNPFVGAEEVSAQYGYLELDVNGSRSSTEPPEAVARRGEGDWLAVDLEIKNLTREDDFAVRDETFTLESGGSIAVAEFEEGSRLELPRGSSVATTLWFDVPDGGAIEDPTLVVRDRDGHPLRLPLKGGYERQDPSPILLDGSYDDPCQEIEFGPGVVSRNVDVDERGEPLPAADVSLLGRADEGTVVISFPVTATERCPGNFSFFSLTRPPQFSGLVDSARVGNRQLDLDDSVGQVNDETIDGYLSISVPDDATGPLVLELLLSDDTPVLFEADLTGLEHFESTG